MGGWEEAGCWNRAAEAGKRGVKLVLLRSLQDEAVPSPEMVVRGGYSLLRHSSGCVD